jgi:hypothetical protein
MKLVGAPVQYGFLDGDQTLVSQSWAIWLLELVQTVNTAPGVSGFVPYTGATQNLDLGTHSIFAANFSGSSSGINTGDQAIVLTGGVTGTWIGGVVSTTVVDIGTSIGTQLTLSGALIENFADMTLRGMTVGLGSGAQVTNVAMGYQALTSNSTGRFNVSVGYQALMSNVSGQDNVAVGYRALKANTTGNDNAALGLNPLLTNTTGSSNIAVGSGALKTNLSGSFNVAIGVISAEFLTGGQNTCVGHGAGIDIVAGSQNICMGAFCSTIGDDTGSITIGAHATSNGSNTTTIGNTSNTDNYLTGSLHLTGAANRILADFSNATVASRTMFQTSTANSNTVVEVIPNGTGTIGQIVLLNNSTPTDSPGLFLSCSSTAANINSAAHGAGVVLPLVLNVSSAEAMRIDTSRNISISCTPAAWQAASSGNAAIQMGNVAFFAASNAPAMGINSYFDGTNFRYISSAAAGLVSLGGTGAFRLYAAAAGTAGNVITYTQTLNVDINANLSLLSTLNTIAYTVATLPAGVRGMRTYVTDALAPTFLAALVGGGAIVCPAFYNGAAWVAN